MHACIQHSSETIQHMIVRMVFINSIFSTFYKFHAPQERAKCWFEHHKLNINLLSIWEKERQSEIEEEREQNRAREREWEREREREKVREEKRISALEIELIAVESSGEQMLPTSNINL